jgi:hypothetical protein
MADVTEGKVITESSLIPYIRRQDVMFDADNLRPNRLARLWFDDIAMNLFTQKGNKIVLNSKKVITLTPNSGSTILADDVFYQGSSNAAPTFSGTVDAYYSANTTLVVKNLSGNFDDSANVNIEVANTFGGRTTGLVAATANISRVVNQNTSDVFVQNEGLRCANTNTFFKVIGSSGENLLYVNENFIQCNIAQTPPNTLTSTAFTVGDLVYQTADGSQSFDNATFVGRVEYYNINSPAVLTLSAVRGQLSVNSSVNVAAFIWNSSNASAPPINATGERLYNLSNGHVLISTSNTTRATIVSHEHTSGAVQNTTGNLDAIYISSSADAANAVGNLVYITAGTGLGQWRRVTSASGKQLNLADSLVTAPTSNSKYSIGNHFVDGNGTLAGILNIPEEPNFKFKTGERVFTITDTDRLEDPDYTMKASAKFATSGLQTVMQDLNLQFPTTPIVIPVPPTPPDLPVPEPAPTEPEPPVVNPVPPRPWWEDNFRRFRPRFRGGDPIAQTFFTPKPKSNKTSYGTFVSSVDLFFGAKPNTATGALQLPVSVKIATVRNGFPTKNYIAIATVKCKDVKVSTSPSVDDPDTITKFTFKDPVYLLPDTEYALVVYSDSPEYECYIAELGGSVLGADPPQRISEQPYAGSFFRSQNATTWTPYQNEDLMFVIHKAVFTGTGSATFNLKDAPEATQNVDRLLLNTNKLTFPVASVDFKVKGIYKSNTAYDTYNYITPHQQFEYGKLISGRVNPAAAAINTRQIVRGNANSLFVLAEFATSDSDVSAIFNKQTLSIIAGEHDVNNGGISNNIISITNRGAGYNAAVTTGDGVVGSTSDSLNTAANTFRTTYLDGNYDIGLYAVTISGGEGSGADGFAVANTTGDENVDYIVINEGGSGYIETPTVTIANGNATTGMITAVAKAQGETGKRGGNINARYITRQITLEEGFESGDLRVFMDCIRPTGTDIQVYYKVLGSEDPERFADKSWVRMFKTIDKNSKDSNQVIELTFRPDLLENKLKYTENGRQYPIGGKFKAFAIKVCLLTSDSTVVPIVTNLRIIATPEG